MRASNFIEKLEKREFFSAATPVTGLEATYFSDMNLTAPVASRIDPVVRFRWSSRAAAPGLVARQSFSARWTATVHTRKGGNYTFFTRSDHGVLLMVNDQPVVNDWSNHATPWSQGQIALDANQDYNLRLEYHHPQNVSVGLLALFWKLNRGQAGAVPRSAVHPVAFSPPPLVGGNSSQSDGGNSSPTVGTTDSNLPGTPTPAPAPTPVPAPVPAPTPTPAPPPTGTTTGGSIMPVPPPPPAPPPIVSIVNQGGGATTTVATGQTITVDPAGAINTIAVAIAQAQPGDTVLIKPGTYHESINLKTSGTAAKPITIAAETAGTVIWDGTGFKTILSSNFANTHYITVKGVNFIHAVNGGVADKAAISTGTGWTLQDITVESVDGTGIDVWGDGVTLLRVTAKNCGLAGISGGGCSNVLVKDCITTGNNAANHPTSDNGGAGKWTGTDHVTVDNLTSSDNTGPGLWFDGNNTNVVIRNSTFTGNHDNAGVTGMPIGGVGISIELTQGPVLIENCTMDGNSGAVVGIRSSSNVTVRHNKFKGSYLDIQDWPRGADHTTHDITVTDNTFDGTKVYASGGTWDATSPTTKAILFAGNTYANSPTALFTWGGVDYDLNHAKATLNLETQPAPTTQP